MNTFPKLSAPWPATRFSRVLSVFAASALLATSFGGGAFAGSGPLEAKLAIARAEASIGLVSRENPAATQDPEFAKAQRTLKDAQIALEHHDNQDAEWLANEAELSADVTAAGAKLTALEHTRTEIANNVNILEIELRKDRN